MLKKTTELEKNSIILLLSWLKMTSTANITNYNELMNECLNSNKTIIDVSKYFDNLMEDLYPIYNILSDPSKEVLFIYKPMQQASGGNFLNKSLQDMINENIKAIIKEFTQLYEKLITTSKFENNNMKNIQRNIILKMIDRYAEYEEYEKCLELKKIIDEI